ncbi:MAG TPA: family 16 glycosylhydrolase [Fibrobacter sp.]|nr:family 16 glycosylhydrolase [Fibrobacter sp.]
MLKKLMIIMTFGLFSSTLFAQDRDYSGAELFSLDSYMYGKFEARMYMAAGSGLVSSMFLYYDDSWLGGTDPWVEIDVEVLGKSPESFQSNIISGNAAKKIMSEQHHSLAVPANRTYHTYSFEWTPSYVAWFIDGIEVRRTTAGINDPKNQVQALVKQQSLRFNLWSSTVPAWVGAWDENILPVNQFINWVKVYDYTPGLGPNGSNFTLAWTDNFDSFDNSRWGKGNWTFDENRVEMHPDNVSIKDGTLILSITKVGLEGFKGVVPVDEQPNSISPGMRSVNTTPGAHQIKTFDLNGSYLGKKEVFR